MGYTLGLHLVTQCLCINPHGLHTRHTSCYTVTGLCINPHELHITSCYTVPGLWINPHGLHTTSCYTMPGMCINPHELHTTSCYTVSVYQSSWVTHYILLHHERSVYQSSWVTHYILLHSVCVSIHNTFCYTVTGLCINPHELHSDRSVYLVPLCFWNKISEWSCDQKTMKRLMNRDGLILHEMIRCVDNWNAVTLLWAYQSWSVFESIS